MAPSNQTTPVRISVWKWRGDCEGYFKILVRDKQFFSWDLEGCIFFAYTESKEMFQDSILAIHWVPYTDLNWYEMILFHLPFPPDVLGFDQFLKNEGDK